MNKRIRTACEQINTKNVDVKAGSEKLYHVKDAVETIKTLPMAKFTEGIDIVVKVNKPAKDKNQIKGGCKLPFGLGKDLKVAIFASPNEVISAGATHISEISNDFKSVICKYDRCGATLAGISIAAKGASVLGPLRLMPSAKNNTVAQDTNLLLSYLKSSVSFVEKNSNIMVRVGSVAMSDSDIIHNIRSFCEYITTLCPDNRNFIKHVYISATMSPSLKLDVQTLK